MSDNPSSEQANVEQPETPKLSAESPRDEFMQQFAALRESFESQLKELKDQNAELKSQNTELSRALVRSATVPQPEPVVEKTEQEIYQEKIDALAKKTLAYMEN